ncbi:helix-turn-helix domain-containing protein [Longispora sp. K20-0274]|uniref:winged helix-turn-helix transcriptional regulator n=1 Tax=Longispora sp. K20-0274 TaxID=3088255 RepID=UPI00399AF104
MSVAEPDVFNPTCGSREVLDLIADKWSALVLYALLGGTVRPAELQRRIGGVSQKMLTQTLRALEHRGLVHREQFPVVPPHVEYSLTPLGASLSPILRALCEWAQDHLADTVRPRAASA